MLHTTVLWAVSGDLPAGWPILGHTHPFYHLFYFVSGTGVFFLDHTPHDITPGTCIIVPPGAHHEVPANTHTLMDVCEVKFLLHDPEIERILINQGPVIHNAPAFIEKAIRYIAYNWANRDPLSLEYMDNFLCAMLLSTHLDQSMSGSHTSTYIDTSPYSDLTRQIIRYVEKNLAEPFQLDNLSAQLGYNKRYLCSTFKKNTGLTIVEYLNHIRIRLATFRLYYHDIPISVVGQHVGYSTSIHFTRVFKSLVGISPSQYRAIYSLGCEDRSPEGHAANPYPSLYEDTLGMKILPLQESIDHLRQLGEFAVTEQLCTTRDIAGESNGAD